MPALPVEREIAFYVMDVARMLRTYADQRGRQFGISRAQWVVLVRLDRSEGLKQSELAEILDLQPISLTICAPPSTVRATTATAPMATTATLLRRPKHHE
jgi:hypothetical protein